MWNIQHMPFKVKGPHCYNDFFGRVKRNLNYYRPHSLVKQGDNALGSIRLSVCPSPLCRVQQRAKKSHYQTMVFVCVSNNRSDANNRADAVDQLLIVHTDF